MLHKTKIHYFSDFNFEYSNKLSLKFLQFKSVIPTLLKFVLKPTFLKFWFGGATVANAVGSINSLNWVFLNKFTITSLFKKYCREFTNFLTSTYRHFYFAKYYYIGLGYKLFMFLGALFIWVGLTHYSLIPIPTSIKIFAKKKRIYILGSSLREFSNLLATIRRVRRMDIYKSKGLLEVKTYKGFIRMKSGKKKQY